MSLPSDNKRDAESGIPFIIQMTINPLINNVPRISRHTDDDLFGREAFCGFNGGEAGGA